MHISGIRIKNYKSFFDSSEIRFERGINVVIGPNSFGKTAILEAAGLHVQYHPHLSIKTKPTRDTPLREEPDIQVAVRVEPQEFKDFCLNLKSDLVFPKFENHDDSLAQLNSFLADGLTIKGRIGPHGFLGGTFDYGLGQRASGFNIVSLGGDDKFNFKAEGGDIHGEFGSVALARWTTAVYRFQSERPNVGRCPFARGNVLKADATNLAEVLNNIFSQRLPFGLND